MNDQNEPVLDQNPATDDDRVAGIVEQVRADVGEDGRDRVIAMLSQRLGDAGLTLPDERIASLADEIGRGDAGEFARKGR